MSKIIPALASYHQEVSPNKTLQEMLKTVKSGDAKLADHLDKASIAKFTERFANADINQIAPEALDFGIELTKTYYHYDTEKLEKAWIGLLNTTSDKTLTKKDIAQTTTADIVWKRADAYAVLLSLYGAERIDFIEYAWKNLPEQSFQDNWERRSFRTKADDLSYFEKRLDLLFSCAGEIEHNDQFYTLPNTERARWAWQFYRINNMLEWSAEIDLADNLEQCELFCVMRDIIYKRDDTGKVSRELVQALLSSQRAEAWELVKELLLSAQRQEGLRQTVLESLDECSRGAIPYFIDVILDNNLTRFASVVRAIDTWTGMAWEADKASACKKFLQSAKQHFDNFASKPESLEPESLKKAINTQNNLDVMAMLWVISIDSIHKVVPLVEHLIASGKPEKVTLAMYLVGQWDTPSLQIPLYLQVLDNEKLHGSLLTLASVLTPLSKFCCRYSAEKHHWLRQSPKLYNQLQNLLTLNEVKEKQFNGKVFNWLTLNYRREDIFKIMSIIAVADLPKLQAFLTDYQDELSLDVRDNLVDSALKDVCKESSYSFDKSWAISQRSTEKTLTELQRNVALTFLDDRGSDVGSTCAMVLCVGKVTESELSQISEWLTTKGKTLKKRLLYVMLAQPTSQAMSLTQTLIMSENTQQRIAGLELALELSQDSSKDRIDATQKQQIFHWISQYTDHLSSISAKKKPTKAETQLLDRFEIVEDGTLSAENGWGLYDPNVLSAYDAPKFDADSVFASQHQLTENNRFAIDGDTKQPCQLAFSKPLETMLADLTSLKEIYQANQDHEYEISTWDGGKEMVLLGNEFSSNSKQLDEDDGQAYVESYPLWQIWSDWYKKVAWTPLDLFLFLFQQESDHFYWLDEDEQPSDMISERYPHYFADAYGKIPKIEDFDYQNPIANILYLLSIVHPYADKNAYFISACQSLYASFDEQVLQWRRPKNDNHYYYHNENIEGWQFLTNASVFLDKLDLTTLTEQQTQQVWHLYRWRQLNGLTEDIPHLQPPFALVCEAFTHQLISTDELMGCLINDEYAIAQLSSLKNEAQHPYQQERQQQAQSLLDKVPELADMLSKVREYCLDIELARGDIETPVSHIVAKFNRFYGINRLVDAMSGLGKQNLYANYIYRVDNGTKRQMFSYIVANCYPQDAETQADFNQAVKTAKLSDERLVQIAIYASQWQPWVENYLQWDGLVSGIWWLKSHTKTAEYEERSSEEESEIAKYSTIAINEFKRGAVDIQWFNDAHSALGKKRWAMLYDCAKFISEGNGHRRAKLYSDVLTNALKIREVTKKVKDKRDQDYLRIYGLVPLSKTNAEKDVLSRYQYLQQFKKESRQFGSQRQASEGLAVQVAMDNLARTAGYPDPLRLGWAMEIKTVQAIFDAGTRFEADDVTVELIIDADGKTDILVEKSGKKQKSIPAKLRKNDSIVLLKQHKKTLTEQYRRARTSLEESMVRGDVFTAKELTELYEHPVISKLLAKLVFITGTNTDTENDEPILGFYGANIASEQAGLTDHAGKTHTLNSDCVLRIAHCVDLHTSKQWRDYQQYCFDHELKQPFKQIFRELYLPTPDELAEKTKSRRYAGHQVQPAKTIALLKSRGWRVDYEEGLQKVYHKAGFRVKMYAMADWFSPADTESPTLETIEFHRLSRLNTDDLNNTDNTDDATDTESQEQANQQTTQLINSYNVPFDKIDPRIFSEVMRDIDLVVSVAHVGEVDPEASQSSIELRAVLLAETVRLFKLDNVTIKEKHAIIQGSMAEYSVHLGSAVAHQVAGSSLSILPVHAQQRGRIFLPFMDDDPKTAELMAKVLLLAKDEDIQDPTVLRQIKTV